MKKNIKIFLLLGILLLFIFSIYILAGTYDSNSDSISEWKMSGRTLDNNRYYPGIIETFNLVNSWNYSIPIIPEITSYSNVLSLSEDFLFTRYGYYSFNESNLYVINSTTGKYIYNKTLYPVKDGVTISDSKIYSFEYRDFDYFLVVRNISNGNELCNFSVYTFGFYGLPIVDNNRVFFVYGSTIAALNATNLEKLWNYSLYTSGGFLEISPSIKNDILYTTDSRGFGLGSHSYALNTTNGELIWNKNISSENIAVYGTLVSENVVLISGHSRMYALNISNGNELWNFSRISEASDSIYNDIVYSASSSGVLAINITNGNLIWNNSDINVGINSPVITQNSLIISNYFSIFFLNLSNGNILKEYYIDDTITFRDIILANNIMYVVGQNTSSSTGYIFAFSVPPISILGTNPVNFYNSSSSSVTFDFKSTDDVEPDTIQLWGNWSGSWSSKYSNSSYVNNTWLNITLTGIPDGLFSWGIFSNDSTRNSNWSSNRTIRIDTTAPTSTATGTLANSSSYTFDTWTNQNVTVTIEGADDGIGMSPGFPVYCVDSDNTCNPSTFISSGTTISSEGISYIRYYSNDTLDNQETVKSQTIKIDKSSPSVSINNPLNATYNTTSITFNITSEDNLSTTNSCYYSLDNGITNNSMTANYCYQETANESTSCGGLNTGSYSFEKNWTNSSYIYDGNFNTFGVTPYLNTGNNGIIYINYSKPSNAMFGSSWKIKGTNISSSIDYNLFPEGLNNSINITIPFECWNYSSSTINFKIISHISSSFKGVYGSGTLFSCYNGIEWRELAFSESIARNTTTLTAGAEIFEESIWWYNGQYTASNNSMTQGSHTVNFYCSDNVNNLNNSLTRTFFIDSINPIIDIVLPENNSYNSDNSLNVYYSYFDTNIDSCWYSNDTYSINTTIPGCGSITTVVWSEGVHNLTIWANDTANNIASDTVSFTIDSIAPNLQILSPLNNENFSDNTLDINYTSTDLHLEECWYSNDTYSINTTLTNCENITTVVWSNTLHNLTIWSNDSAGNINSTTINFLIDSITPNISLLNPSNNTYTSESSNNFTTNITDNYGIKNATLNIFNSTGLVNFSNINLGEGTNFIIGIVVNLIEGVYNWFYQTFDFAGNYNVTNNNTLIIDSTNPLISYSIGTPENNSNLSQNYIFVNISLTEINLKNITYSLYNSSLVNLTTYNSEIKTINWTNLLDGNYYFNVTVFDLSNNNNFTNTYKVTLDSITPNISLLNPSNNTYTSESSNNFTTNITDNYGIKNATLNIFNSTGLVNFSNINLGEGTNFIIGIVVNLIEGVYNWFYQTFDFAGNYNVTNNNTLIIDLTFPQIEYNPSTYENNSYRQSGDIFINVSSTDTYLNSTTLEFNGTNQSFSNNEGNNYWINKTSLTEGTYYFYGFNNDSAGNYNFTDRRTIHIDLNDPVVIISSPTPSSYNYENITINYTATDLNLDSCWYTVDEGVTNISLPGCINTSYEFTEGTKNILIYANDSSGRVSYDSVSFTISLASPSVTLNYPTDNLWLNYGNNIQFNYTASDDTLSACKFYSNSTGVWHLNQTTFSPNNGSVSTFLSNLTNGTWIWNVECNDTVGNSAWGNPTSNNSINIDTINPLINFIETTPSNNSNTTSTSIFINISLTELNFNNITYNLYNSIGIYNTTTYTTLIENITYLNLPDSIYYFNVTVRDKAGNINSTETRLIRLDDTPPTLNIQSPLAQNYANNNSINLNYTVTDNLIGLDECWYFIYNINGTLTKTIEILSNCENDTFSLPGGDNNFKLTLLSSDLLGNVNSKDVIFGIRTNSPAVTLGFSNDTHINYLNNHLFNYTVSTGATSILNCSLYGNFTGVWELNQTMLNPTQSIVNNFNLLNLSEEKYEFNVLCFDDLHTPGWGLNNQTYIVDISNPNLTISSLSTSQGSQTISFNTLVEDNYLSTTTCKYSIYNSGGTIDGTNSNVTFNCNELTSATATTYGTFTLDIYVIDKATNLNHTNRTFTLSPTTPSTGGGGGGITIIGTNETQWIMTTSSGGGAYKLITIPGTEREFFILLQNLGTSPRSITLRCEDVDGTFCQYVKFENTSISLPAINNFTTAVKFTITTPNDVTTQTQLFNIRGKDDLGLDGILTVETSGAGILISVTSKLLSNKIIAGLKIPYLVISLVIWTVLSFILSLLIKDKKDNKNIGLSVLISLVLTFIILAFI